LLKEFGAIQFNDFLQDPEINILTSVILSLVIALIAYIIKGGERINRLKAAGIAFVASMAVLVFVSMTRWFANPGLTIFGTVLATAGIALLITYLIAGVDNKRSMIIAGSVVVLGGILYYPLIYIIGNPKPWFLVIVWVVFVVVAAAIGYFAGGEDKLMNLRIAGIIGFLYMGIFFIDSMMRRWSSYVNNVDIGGRPIHTIGSETPNLSGSFWIFRLDGFTHLILPTISLTLISFAGYIRYMRSATLEVMNADYIRTARAKGLKERVVVVRHGFRNALLPLATIIPADIAGIFGGAVITEKIFGWKGMGTIFITAVNKADFNSMMGYLVIISALAIAANIVSDLLYAALDPRIRVTQ
jgi:peptide/nickel transport system permease protein